MKKRSGVRPVGEHARVYEQIKAKYAAKAAAEAEAKAAASKDILLDSSSKKIGGANGTGPIAEVEPQDEWILSIETRVMAMKTREQKRRSEALRKRRAILESQKKQDTQFERWEKIAERASESENGNANA